MKKMKEYWKSLVEEKGKKKALGTVTLLCIVLVGLICIPIYGSMRNTSSKTKTVDYLSYVDGLKNWEVEIGEDVDFLEDVTWDKEFIKTVTVNDDDVDLEKEGTYCIVYTIDVKKDDVKDLKSKKSVKVVKAEEQKETKDDKEGSTKEQETDDSGKEESKIQEATEQIQANEKASSNKVSSSSQSKQSGNTQKGESKPAHQHNWVAQTKTVHHDAVTEQRWVVDVPSQQQAITVCNQCGAVLTADTYIAHDKAHVLAGGNGGWHTEYRYTEEQGHYETIIVQQGWDEQVVIGYKCSSCGATK